MRVKARVKPNASRNEVEANDNELRVYTTVSPERGKANEMVCKLVAKHFHVPLSRVHIVRGHTSKIKLLEIEEYE